MHSLIEPRILHLSAGDREQTRLLNTLLLLLMPVTSLLAVLQLSPQSNLPLAGVGILGFNALMLVAYLTSLKGNYLHATVIACITLMLGSCAMILLNPTGYSAYILLFLPLLLAGVFLPLKITGTLTFLAIGLPVGVSTQTHQSTDLLHFPALFSVVCVALLTLYMLQRRIGVEKIRLDEMHRKSESNLHALAENSSDGIFVIKNDRNVYFNRRACEIFGYTSDEMKHLGLMELADPAEYPNISHYFQCRLAGKHAPAHYQTQALDKLGNPLPIEISVSMTLWEGSTAAIVIIRDIGERIRAEEETKKLSSALHQAGDAVMITNRDGVIEYINPAFERMTGYRAMELHGKLARIFKTTKHDQEFNIRLRDTLTSGQLFTQTMTSKRKDGTLYYEDLTISPLKNKDGEITHFIATGHDITERVETQQRLDHMAHHDALTGLANRTRFVTRLQQAIARAQRHKRLLSVMFIDLDRFKHINDTLGHDVGDALLIELSKRVLQIMRIEDTFARFGGDEFAILFDDIGSGNHVIQLAGKILATLEQPFTLKNHTLQISGSIGICIYPDDGADVTELMKHADIAMYHAKESGRNNYKFYSAEMGAVLLRRQMIESHLNRALANNQFELYYQPIIDLVTREIHMTEVLLRWNHPELGLLAPVEFMKSVEEAGLLRDINDWVLNQACQQANLWRKTKGDLSLRLSLNLCVEQLADMALPQTIATALENNHLGPHHLEVECTETILMENPEAAEHVLKQLSEMGVGLTLDNFGSGQLALRHLQRFPINTLKINSLALGQNQSQEDRDKLITGITALADSLHIGVTAVGIETQEQFEHLLQTSCRQAQGFFFSKPVPVQQAHWFL